MATERQAELFRPGLGGVEIPTEDLPPRAAVADPPTSAASAETLERTGKLRIQCAETLAALQSWWREHGTAPTSHELADGDAVARYQHARRLPDLARLGLVLRGPERECAITGRRSVTWRLSVTGEERGR